MLSRLTQYATSRLTLPARGLSHFSSSRIRPSNQHKKWESIHSHHGIHAKQSTPCPSNQTFVHHISQLRAESPTILNLGAGNGDADIAIAQARPDATLFPIDYSNHAIFNILARTQHHGLEDRVVPICSDITDFDMAKHGPYDAINMDMVLQYLSHADRKTVIERARDCMNPDGLICIRVLHTGSDYHEFISRQWTPLPDQPNSYHDGFQQVHFFTEQDLLPHFKDFRLVANLQTEFLPLSYQVQKYMQSLLLIFQKRDPSQPLQDFKVPRLPFLRYFRHNKSDDPHTALLLGATKTVKKGLLAQPDMAFDRIDENPLMDRPPYDFIAGTWDDTLLKDPSHKEPLIFNTLTHRLDRIIKPGGAVSINVSSADTINPTKITQQSVFNAFNVDKRHNKFLFYAQGFHHRPHKGVDRRHHVWRFAYQHCQRRHYSALPSRPHLEKTAIPGVYQDRHFLSPEQVRTYYHLAREWEAEALAHVQRNPLSKITYRHTNQDGYDHVPLQDGHCRLFENYGEDNHRLLSLLKPPFPAELTPLMERVRPLIHTNTQNHRWRVSINYYNRKPSAETEHLSGFPFHKDLRANGDHTFILSLDYGLLEFLPCPDRFDGMPTQERLEHYLKKTDPLPLLVRPGELIWLDGSLPPGSGCGRWDWLHRVVPTNEFFEFEGRQYQTQHRISLVFGR